MKLAPRDAARYFAKPDPTRAGVLIFGQDAMRVALKRQELIANLIGPGGEEEMRLSRLQAGDLRKDPAMLSVAVKSQGFFPGPRVAFVEDATETSAPVITAALTDWQEGDAQIVVTAGNLKPRGALRKLFESHSNAFAVGIYDDPPTRDEIEADLKRAGVKDISPEAMTDLTGLSRELDPGDFRQTMEKLGLYKLGDPSPVIPDDVLAVSPTSTEAGLDDLLHATAEGRSGEIGPVLARLQAQGADPVGLCIAATRHFRALHAASADPGGPGQGINRLRPPVHFKSRDRMVRQAQHWGLSRLEQALEILVDTDLTLRSTQKAPVMALMERTLIRLAMLGGRR
ncbi:DNA polymerase III subunit delta [Aliiroseovarius zhejiangensis]|uniref:DNA-directed DNA polymerase n=1 Tax=Aliiroseovarius zhejiangensis TaxID=1632025 RepID=A0ABQ3JAA3_9RHOB|nr:DNA polymerase III subunit delta [Aliiroseovarius zhejiangensis]GHF06955.1 DNA polymerase III subunit delta [Aliiroseovarius zhejiangensis]